MRSSGVGPDYLRWTQPDDQIVARVGDEDLRKSQIFDALLETVPDQVRAQIAVLLSNRILAAECNRHGIRVNEETVATWWNAQLRVLRQRAESEEGRGVDLDRWMQLKFGQEIWQYERTAKNRERARRLLERLIRYQELLEDRVELRIISVTDRQVATQLREQIDRGADFAILAEQYSVHPSAEQGGLMVPVWRKTLHDELDRVAFDMQTGSVSSIIQLRDDAGRDRYQIIKLVRRLPGREVSYDRVKDEIVNGLRERPLSQDEWYMWQLRLERSGVIRLFDL